MFGKQRGVTVQTTVTRQIQNGLRQNLAVGRDDNQVGLQVAQFRNKRFLAGTSRLQHGESGGEGLPLPVKDVISRRALSADRAE